MSQLIIPDELIRRIVAIGKVEWAATKANTDEQHIEDFRDTLRITREHFSLPEGPRELHGVYIAGTNMVVCHTGTSPNSQLHAQIIAGLWNNLVDAVLAAPVDPRP